MGTMDLSISTGGAFSSIWSETGDKGNAWIMQTVDLTPYIGPNVQLKFTGTIGSSWSGDMAIDTLTINDVTVSSPYTTWAAGTFTNAFSDNAIGSNPDGDDLNNLLEFALGTDPTVSDSASLVADGSVNGLPVPVSSDGGTTFDLVFVRRDDHGVSGSLTYIPQFSSDLVTWTASAATPAMVANSTDDAAYELVKVPYTPTLPDGKPARFGRIKVTVVP